MKRGRHDLQDFDRHPTIDEGVPLTTHPAEVNENLGLAQIKCSRLIEDAERRGDQAGADAWLVARNAIEAAEKAMREARTKQDWSKRSADYRQFKSQLAPKPSTLRQLKVGDCFRWLKPPTGYTDQKIMLVESLGFAAPEGWDYMPIGLLDNEVEILQEQPKASQPPFEFDMTDES